MTQTEQLPFISHSETSREAAESMKTAAKTQRDRVVAYFRGIAPWAASDESAAADLGMSPNSFRPRRVEAARAGWIKPAGKGKTLAGRSCQLWRAT